MPTLPIPLSVPVPQDYQSLPELYPGARPYLFRESLVAFLIDGEETPLSGSIWLCHEVAPCKHYLSKNLSLKARPSPATL